MAASPKPRSSTSSNEDRWLMDLGINPDLMDTLLDKSKNLGPEVVHDTRFDSILTPFDLVWTFGFGVNVPLISLANEQRTEVFYTSVNVGVLYDYCKKEMFLLRGHQTRISAASADASGQWLVTADNGKENVLNFWDTFERRLIYTIFNHPKPPYKLIKLSVSPSAKVLITITREEEVQINFWFWTYGRDTPDYSYVCENEDSYGEPKSVEYHPNREEHFMVVFERCVLFFHWNENEGITSKPTMPTVGRLSGSFTDGTYVEECHECFLSTNKGYLFLFGTTIFVKPYTDQNEMDNRKKFIKSIKISNHAITVLTTSDGVIVAGDSTGRILFFDSTIRLLYWITKGIENKGIHTISFKKKKRKYKYVRTKHFDEDELSIIADCHHEDRTQEYETIIEDQVPHSASLEHTMLTGRDFFVSTADGSLYSINFMRNEFVAIFAPCDGYITSMDVHDELPHLLVAYNRGLLTLIDYSTHEELISEHAPIYEDIIGSVDATITCVKFSKCCLHLACGKSNGELWMLQPALLSQIYTQPLKYGDGAIIGITFSSDSLQMAYYDDRNTVFGLIYDPSSEDWIFKGKLRSHYKEICNLFFLEEELSGLYSLGKDRNLIRYEDLNQCDEDLIITNRERVEQRAVPVYFIPYVRKKYSKSGYFLMADNEYKYKTVTTTTNMCTAVYLGPAYGCFSESHVRKMEFVPSTNHQFLVFMNKRHIGLQMLPIDGNPYRYVGLLGHPEELLDFRVSYDGCYVFTCGKKDRTIFMWRIKFFSAEVMHKMGGEELQPFYCLLEGGRNGFLFQEMRDLFYYMQILQQGEKIPIPRVVTNSINLAELPDLVRACGYYPSEYEIENLLTDIRYKDFDDMGLVKDKATFCEFVKLYINHRPAHGYSVERLEEAFDIVTGFDEDNYEGEIDKDSFVEAIMSTGENVSREQLFKCFVTLLHYDLTQTVLEEMGGGEKDFSFLPDLISFDNFTDEILGIDMGKIQNAPKEDEDDEDGSGGSYYRAMYGDN